MGFPSVLQLAQVLNDTILGSVEVNLGQFLEHESSQLWTLCPEVLPSCMCDC